MTHAVDLDTLAEVLAMLEAVPSPGRRRALALVRDRDRYAGALAALERRAAA